MLTYPLRGGIEVRVVVPYFTRMRLVDTCFRGPYTHRAGNFLKWRNLEDVFGDDLVLAHLLTEIEILRNRGERGLHSIEIDLPAPIGWSSTSPVSAFKEHDLQRFALNCYSVGLRIRLDRCDLVAPKTTKLTIVFWLHSAGKDVTAIVRAMYTGEDIGDMIGDVTSRKQVAFFDRDHPGEE